MISWMFIVMLRLLGSVSFGCSVLVGIINIEPPCDEWRAQSQVPKWTPKCEGP